MKQKKASKKDKRAKKKEGKKQGKIDALMNELNENDTMYSKNKDEYKVQVQIGMHKKGLPAGTPMYDSLIDAMTAEIEDLQIQLDSGFEVLNPTFKYQIEPRWVQIQKTAYTKSVKAKKQNLEEIKKNVEEVEKEITNQQARIKNRRIQLLEDLEKLGMDVKELKKKSPDYIG